MVLKLVGGRVFAQLGKTISLMSLPVFIFYFLKKYFYLNYLANFYHLLIKQKKKENKIQSFFIGSTPPTSQNWGEKKTLVPLIVNPFIFHFHFFLVIVVFSSNKV
jgi:hypothetical protein